MINELFNKLKEHNLTLSAAESITGGKFSSLITNEFGASEFFKGSFVCYSNEYKYNVLKVNKGLEIISNEMAIELSQNSRRVAGSDISISFTGNASENGIEGKPKGLSYIAISNKDVTEVVEYKSIEKERDTIIEDTSIFGIQLLLNFIGQNYKI